MLVMKIERKKLLWRRRRRRKGDIERDLKKWDEKHRLDWSGSAKGGVAGSCECSNELYINHQLDVLIIIYS